jgi:hypothetical protein
VTIPVHKENVVPLPVVLTLEMCAEAGTTALSLGKEGERMVCERQLPIGSHLPRCVCRDEGMILAQTNETQDLLHRLEAQPLLQQKN